MLSNQGKVLFSGSFVVGYPVGDFLRVARSGGSGRRVKKILSRGPQKVFLVRYTRHVSHMSKRGRYSTD
jgi:hypothetical protein